jgi:hypothetical protein
MTWPRRYRPKSPSCCSAVTGSGRIPATPTQQERGVRRAEQRGLRPDQEHQVRLLAAELGGAGIRVNGINPDGVVRGSGIFAGGWGAQRAAVYGVPEEELGAYYAQRTLLKREVLPGHVAAAVVALTAGDLPGMRALLRATQPLRRFEPSGDPGAWAAAAARIGV